MSARRDSLAVECTQLCKRFGDDGAVNDLDLWVRTGEILALVGPSGCGKTTTLRLIAGFERPDRGQITLGERIVAGSQRFVPPEQRGVGMVFQDYALFPHLTVFENVAFGLNSKRVPSLHRETREMLDLVGLANMAKRYPHELSGGERQRVALARALAPRPVLVLLDEPFSNLDADRRARMREEVRDILKSIAASAIFVTHDQEEALFMGDRLAVLNRGSLEQMGSPEDIFHQPATLFVAEFMGSTDFIPGIVTPRGVATEIGLLPQKLDLPAGSAVDVAVRADDVSFRDAPETNAIVIARHFKGAFNIYRLRLASGWLVHCMRSHTCSFEPGVAVYTWADPGHSLACFYQGKLVKELPSPSILEPA